MKTRWLLFLAMVFVLLPLRSAFAQSRATLRGTVTDESHATLPGVSVTATELATGLSKKTVTGSDGAYILTELAPGTYKAAFSSDGYFDLFQNISVEPGHANTVNAAFELKP